MLNTMNEEELEKFLALMFKDIMMKDLSWTEEYKKKTGKDPFEKSANKIKES